MIRNISQLRKRVLVSINNELHNPSFTNYNEIFEDCILSTHQDFVEKYKINFQSTIHELHLITIYEYKTFDGGEIEIELHKFDADYDFKYNTKIKTAQTKKIQEEFEVTWINDDLAIQLF
jgi:hypothetical protein